MNYPINTNRQVLHDLNSRFEFHRNYQAIFQTKGIAVRVRTYWLMFRDAYYQVTVWLYPNDTVAHLIVIGC